MGPGADGSVSCPHGNVWEGEASLGAFLGGAGRNRHRWCWVINRWGMEEVRAAGALGTGE